MYIQGRGPSDWGLSARLTTLICNKKYCHEIQGIENAESSKEGCDLKRAVLPMMMMMFILYIMTVSVSLFLVARTDKGEWITILKTKLRGF
jgi:hypothetical protein